LRVVHRIHHAKKAADAAPGAGAVHVGGQQGCQVSGAVDHVVALGVQCGALIQADKNQADDQHGHGHDACKPGNELERNALLHETVFPFLRVASACDVSMWRQTVLGSNL
jgi:hypothetical protein